jgi:hypothetical protein
MPFYDEAWFWILLFAILFLIAGALYNEYARRGTGTVSWAQPLLLLFGVCLLIAAAALYWRSSVATSLALTINPTISTTVTASTPGATLGGGYGGGGPYSTGATLGGGYGGGGPYSTGGYGAPAYTPGSTAGYGGIPGSTSLSGEESLADTGSPLVPVTNVLTTQASAPISTTPVVGGGVVTTPAGTRMMATGYSAPLRPGLSSQPVGFGAALPAQLSPSLPAQLSSSLTPSSQPGSPYYSPNVSVTAPISLGNSLSALR